VTFTELYLLSLDVEQAFALDDDLKRIVVVRALMIRLRREKRIDADLKPRRVIDDLVATPGVTKVRFDGFDVESVS
jgi:hypothetical protein